jgi:integrase
MLRPSEVRRADVQAFVDDLLARKSASSTGNVINPLQAFYKRAMDREEVSFNPTEGIDVPTGKTQRPRRIVPPTEDRPIWATAFYAGLRRGELQALRCMDIDLGANLIYVRKGWDQVEGEIEPKSEAGKDDSDPGDPARLPRRATTADGAERGGSDLRSRCWEGLLSIDHRRPGRSAPGWRTTQPSVRRRRPRSASRSY